MRCNNSFAPDEEYMSAFLGLLLWVDDIPLSRISQVLDSNWAIQNCFDDGLIVTEDNRVAIMPDEDRLRKVITKNAVGQLHSIKGVSTISRPDKVSICPLENLPDETRDVLFGPGPSWMIAQERKYRFQVIEHGAVFVRTVIHEYLGTEVVWNRLSALGKTEIEAST